jgi:hypothetical protein
MPLRETYLMASQVVQMIRVAFAEAPRPSHLEEEEEMEISIWR